MYFGLHLLGPYCRGNVAPKLMSKVDFIYCQRWFVKINVAKTNSAISNLKIFLSSCSLYESEVAVVHLVGRSPTSYLVTPGP